MEKQRWNKGIYLTLGGLALVFLGGFVSNPSTPLSTSSEIGSIVILGGIVTFIWGVVALKRSKEEAMREKRRSMDTDDDNENLD